MIHSNLPKFTHGLHDIVKKYVDKYDGIFNDAGCFIYGGGPYRTWGDYLAEVDVFLNETAMTPELWEAWLDMKREIADFTLDCEGSVSICHGQARLQTVVSLGLLQRKLIRRPYAGMFHWCIYGSMLLLTLGTVLVAFQQDVLLRLSAAPILRNGSYFAFEACLDTGAGFLVLGLLLAMGRRLWAKPAYLENTAEAYSVLALLLFIALSGLALEGMGGDAAAGAYCTDGKIPVDLSGNGAGNHRPGGKGTGSALQLCPDKPL